MRRRLNIFVAMGGMVATGGNAVADGPLPRTELAKLGKSSTALVFMDRNPRTFGTAFVVHPSGYLLTSAHTVVDAIHEGSKTPVRVVLNSGNENQLSLAARVVRADKELDIAILKVVAPSNLPALPLGDSDRVSELTELIGFGYQLGFGALPSNTDFPSVSVAAITISSVRRKDNTISEIQFERGFTGVVETGPTAGASLVGQAGGPLLFADGKVAGAFPGNIRRTSAVIPVNVLKTFLATPDITLTAPILEHSKLNDPTEFTASVVTPLPGGTTPAVEMIVDLGDGQPRSFPMVLKDGFYRASAVPIPRAVSAEIGITAKFAQSVISGTVSDRELTIDGKPIKFSEVRRIEFGDSPRAVTLNGQSVSGTIRGLDQVEVKLANQMVRIDLAKANNIEIASSIKPATLVYSVVGKIDGKEVGRKSVAVTLAGAGDNRQESRTPLDLESVRVAHALPEKVTDVCLGAGGRYLLFLFPKLSKIGLFDVSQARIVHYFPIPDANVKFAAGADKLVVGLTNKGILQRWSLTNFERELSIPFVHNLAIHTVLLGHASNGPVIVNGDYLSLDTLQRMPVQGHSKAMEAFDAATQAMISADGTVVTRTNTHRNPGGLFSTVLEGNVLQTVSLHKSSDYIVPSSDGKMVFTSNFIYTTDLIFLTHHTGRSVLRFLPAAQGNMFISLRHSRVDEPGVDNNAQRVEIALHVSGDMRPVVRIGQLKGDLLGLSHPHSAPFCKRVFLIPEAKLLVVLAPNNETVNLFPFDFEETLLKAGTDFLFVLSDPPTHVKKGDSYRHQLVAKSNRGSVKFKLETGPEGMTVSPSGLINWAVPVNFKGISTLVMVSITDDSRQEAFKSFTLRVVE